MKTNTKHALNSWGFCVRMIGTMGINNLSSIQYVLATTLGNQPFLISLGYVVAYGGEYTSESIFLIAVERDAEMQIIYSNPCLKRLQLLFLLVL